MVGDEEDEPVILERTARATRGKRMTKLLDEETEQDEAFWNQDALKEEEEDNNYEEESEVADEFDSDFNEDEPGPDEGPESEAIERLPLKKRLIFPGKLAAKKKIKNKVLSKLEKVPKKEKSSEKSTHSEEHQVGPDDLEVERTVRKSTRTSVIVRQAERDAIRAELQATMKPIKRKKEGEEKRMTQEEMLLEAAETEVINRRTLERVLAREEEVKKKAVVHKEVNDGPQMRYTSKDGKSLLEFVNGASFQAEISTASVPYPQKSFCVVTGLPAKYRDPKTGIPYATKEAFKAIRERFIKEECERKNQKKMNMGELFDSVPSEGFEHKRRRSEPSRKRFSDLRVGARFRSIPALDELGEE